MVWIPSTSASMRFCGKVQTSPSPLFSIAAFLSMNAVKPWQTCLQQFSRLNGDVVLERPTCELQGHPRKTQVLSQRLMRELGGSGFLGHRLNWIAGLQRPHLPFSKATSSEQDISNSTTSQPPVHGFTSRLTCSQTMKAKEHRKPQASRLECLTAHGALRLQLAWYASVQLVSFLVLATSSRCSGPGAKLWSILGLCNV